MHTIDLGKYKCRTDLVVEGEGYKSDSSYTVNKNISVEKKCDDSGRYVTISFLDVTDKDNYKMVEKTFITELKEILGDVKDKKILVVGLGNYKSTPDALGPDTINNILVTRHLFSLGEVEDGYSNVCSFKPGVTGVTGIETSELINNLVSFLKIDLLIVIDALAARSIERVNRTIQISDAGISPGSGVYNNRGEISTKTLNIPVIAIGVPTIVEATVIVSDTFNYMLKHFSYKLENINNPKLKLVMEDKQDYRGQEINLSDIDKERILGMVGTLSKEELDKLFYEVLTPINFNMMVTPKEIDFIIEKLSMLIGNGINKSLHDAFNTTN